MTKSTIHIPPAALEAGARGLAAVRMPNYTWDDLDREMQDYLRKDARAAFEAMVEAWPGMFETPATFCMTLDDYRDCLLLPLPTENSDDE